MKINIFTYLLKKIFFLFLSVFVIVSFSYFIVSIYIPNPASANLSEQNIIVRYFLYLGDILFFKFGLIYDENLQTSFSNPSLLFFNYFKWSFLVIIVTFFLGIILGYIIGVLVAYKYHSSFATGFNTFIFIFSAVPIFIIAPIILSLSENVNIPTLFISPDIISFGITIYSLMIPIAILLLGTIATVSSLTKNAVVFIIRSDYINYIKCCGLSNLQIFFKYILKNSLVSLIGYIPALYVSLITFSLIIERIFQIPGQSIILSNTFELGEINIIMFLILFMTFTILGIQTVVEILQKVLSGRGIIKKRIVKNNIKKILKQMEINEKQPKRK